MPSDHDLPPGETPPEQNPFSAPAETPADPASQRRIGIPMVILIGLAAISSGIVAFGCTCFPLAVSLGSAVGDGEGFILGIGLSILVSLLVMFFVGRALARSERRARRSTSDTPK